MAKADKSAANPADPADPFSGLSPEQVAAVKAYVDSMVAGERKAMDALIEEASKPIGVAAAAGLDSSAPSTDNLMSAIGAMYTSASEFIAEIERYGRTAAQNGDQGNHTDFSRLAMVFGEFRNGLATILPPPSLD